MMAWLKIIRPWFLVLIAGLQYALRDFLLKPLLEAFGHQLLLPDFQFALLVGSTVLLTAAGYLINDYFDIKTDVINKPKEVIVGRGISRRMAMFGHMALTFIAICIALYVAWYIRVTILVLIQILSAGLIWFYATDYKRQFLSGNVVMASLTVIIISIVPLFEPAVFQLFFSDRNMALLILKVVGFYAGIAFLLAFAWSFAKDVQDTDGDSVYGSSTLAIEMGLKWSRIILISILSVIIVIVAYIQFLQFTNEAWLPLSYILLTVQFPLLWAIYSTARTKTEEDFGSAKQILGFVMLSGTLSIFVLYFAA